MKYIVYLIAVLFPVFLSAVECPCSFSIEPRISCFTPYSGKMRRIYKKHWAEYELESTARWCGCPWGVWGNVSYFEESGHSIGERDRTYMQLLPVTVGIKCYLSRSCLQPYLGVGVGTAYARLRDRSEYTEREVNKWGFSSLFKAGLEFNVYDCLFADLFVDYAVHAFDFCKHKRGVERHHPQMGGLKIGLGLGWTF